MTADDTAGNSNADDADTTHRIRARAVVEEVRRYQPHPTRDGELEHYPERQLIATDRPHPITFTTDG